MEEQKYLDGQTIAVRLEDIELDENQPRKQIDEDALNVLVQSIKSEGLIQNIAVRPIEGGKFKIVAGERRFRAFRELSKENPKWNKVNAVIRLVDDRQALNLALTIAHYNNWTRARPRQRLAIQFPKSCSATSRLPA